jgi:short subunit dehydrogenase-like uncharacterized protein
VAARIVLFGATGYTGRLTARRLVELGARPVLAGRSAGRLEALAAELGGGLDTAVADVARPETVRALLEPGDVLISTVGPFARWGRPAIEAAISAGASYIDSTGEPQFVREVFDEHGPRAEAGGAGLVTAFGYDYVPGNLAGALALREAGDRAARVDVGYFAFGAGAGAASAGTKASLAGAAIAPGFAWRDGRLRDDRAASRVRSFDVRGRQRSGVSLGGSEHYGLPRVAPGLREVNVYFGWFGPLSRPMQAATALSGLVTRLPGAAGALSTASTRLTARFASGDPSPEEETKGESYVLAIAYDGLDEPLAEVRLSGPNGYVFTAGTLAWGAMRAAKKGLLASGALGPVDAFGLDQLEKGCAEAGLVRAGAAPASN